MRVTRGRVQAPSAVSYCRAAMSAAEREKFLAGVHAGVLSVAVGQAGRTLAVPVWYSYQPGEQPRGL